MWPCSTKCDHASLHVAAPRPCGLSLPNVSMLPCLQASHVGFPVEVPDISN
jgi:hypothetical protein